MMKITFAPAMDVTQACVRRRFRHASCHACADVCPAQAFSVTDGQVTIDPSRCIECGDCLFVCPTDAISGVVPQRRFINSDTLTGPFAVHPPTVNELLLWHAQYGIRFISIDAESSSAWMVALARLNLALRRLGEPAWSFKAVPASDISLSRRALIHAPREDVKACTVQPGKRQQRQAFPRFSKFDVLPDTEKCILCGACWRSCPEKAIRFEDNALVMENARCTGCGGCEAVCPSHAIKVMPAEGEAQQHTWEAQAAICTSCSRPFWRFNADEKQCYLCAGQTQSMRNLTCC
ncbi:4Fe-4S dicluster domain-containing protein [Enterobacter cancerogenus]|uniref:4Fe-4S dicluster domain-containing protein n=1 Tax=Enterobacter cancerogenus TaxID=69218 RepID=UPI001F2DFCC6|nr:4Fe-4S dicluster domain-containing protein [Enterobacter cancerogenus]